MNSSDSLINNPDPVVRTTYRAHLWLYILGAPFIAMIQYSPNLAVKTFDAHAWVPALAALIPASHLLAIFFAQRIRRSDKTSWVVWPMIISNIMFFLLVLVHRTPGWQFASVVILGYILRAPIISAQSAIFRANYPPHLRSFAFSVPLALQYAGISLYGLLCGRLFDRTEKFVIPAFILSAFLGVVGAWKFRQVKCMEDRALVTEEASEEKAGFFDQFHHLWTNKGFLYFQIAYIFFGSGFVAILAVLPFYLEAEFNADHSASTTAINAIPSFTIALTTPIWGRLLDRYNPVVMRTIVNGVWCLTPILLYFAHSIHGVYWAQLIQGCAWSGSTLIWWLAVNYYARSHEVANLMSLHQTLTGVRGICAPFLGKWIGDHYGYRNSMLFWFVLMMIGFFIMVGEVIREKRLGKLKTFSEAEAGMAEVVAGGGAEKD